jgi:hypothetical protein
MNILMAGKSTHPVVIFSIDGADLPVLEHLRESRGMTQIALLSRLVCWLARQNPSLQEAILAAGWDPSKNEAVRRSKLRALATQSEFPAPHLRSDVTKIEAQNRG